MGIRLASVVFSIFLVFQYGNTQKSEIVIANPSFEGIPHSGGADFRKIPKWEDCGRLTFKRETPPDLHNSQDPATALDRNKSFGVAKRSSDGRTFLGMVARDNETYESVTQRLSAPIEAGKCYSFSIDLCHSDVYISPYPKRDISKSYTEPIVLRIYGGSTYCNKRELLAESEKVSNTDWEQYDFKFEPENSHRFLTLVAFYKTPVLIPYNGNLLLDNASNIVEIPCPDEEVIAEIEKPKTQEKPKTKPVEDIKTKDIAKVDSKEVKNDPPVIPKPKVTKPDINTELERKKIKKGQIVNIKNLFFEANKAVINEKSHSSLDELVTFLEENPDLRIEVGGHTNGRPEHAFCDSLSTVRSKAVADYLIEKGIPTEQVEYKGYGKRKPIATNKTKAGRAKNQRVEIKILEFKD